MVTPYYLVLHHPAEEVFTLHPFEYQAWRGARNHTSHWFSAFIRAYRSLVLRFEFFIYDSPLLNEIVDVKKTLKMNKEDGRSKQFTDVILHGIRKGRPYYGRINAAHFVHIAGLGPFHDIEMEIEYSNVRSADSGNINSRTQMVETDGRSAITQPSSSALNQPDLLGSSSSTQLSARQNNNQDSVDAMDNEVEYEDYQIDSLDSERDVNVDVSMDGGNIAKNLDDMKDMEKAKVDDEKDVKNKKNVKSKTNHKKNDGVWMRRASRSKADLKAKEYAKQRAAEKREKRACQKAETVTAEHKW